LWPGYALDIFWAMAGHTCYLGLPRPALEEILGASGCFTLMQALWHRNGGAWSTAFEEREAVAAMAEEFGLAERGSALVDRYARLLEALDARYPETRKLFVRVKWPHDVLQVLLTQYLTHRGITAAARLASAAVRGDIASEALGELTCLSEATVVRIGSGLSQAPRSSWPPHRNHAAFDDELHEALEHLLLLYARASELSHLVLIG